MEFITTGNRIAVENFDKGKLYTVLWKNDTQENLMCISIGADCVIFQGEAPINLFTLSMRNADTIDSIEPTQLGTTNYNNLINKPQINGVDLIGNKTGDQLGLASQADLEDYATNASVVAGLATKQDALSSSQLAAVNSGITSEDVEQISTNKNNISLINGTQTFSDIMFADSTILPYVTTDTDGQKIATFNGTSGTKFWYTYSGNIAPYNVINFAILAKTSSTNWDSGSLGTGIDIRFFDKNNTQIGAKYTMEVMQKNRYGYQRFQHISPAGTDHYVIRVFTRGATTAIIKSINVNVINVMPMIDSDSVIYDCHLGSILFAPKNTWAAYEMAKQMGFKNLIINVKRTSDDKLVCIHDATIDATSDGTGAVSSFTYEQLLQYDFGSWFSLHYTGQRIPLVDDVLQFIAKSGMNVIISIHDTNSNADIDDLYTLIKKYNLLGNCMIKSYFTAQIEYAYSKFGDGAMYDLVTETAPSAEIETWITTFGHLNYIETNYGVINETFVAHCKTLGCDVIGGIVQYVPSVYNAIAAGCKRFTSDMCSDMVC